MLWKSGLHTYSVPVTVFVATNTFTQEGAWFTKAIPLLAASGILCLCLRRKV